MAGQLTTAGLDGITALPDHGADGARVHVLNQTREEGLASEIGICERSESIGNRYNGSRDGQCFSRCSLPGVTSLMAASLKLFPNVRMQETYDARQDCLPSVLEAGDDGTNEATLEKCQFTTLTVVALCHCLPGHHRA